MAQTQVSETPGPAGRDHPRLRLPRLAQCSSYITGEVLPIIGGHQGG